MTTKLPRRSNGIRPTKQRAIAALFSEARSIADTFTKDYMTNQIKKYLIEGMAFGGSIDSDAEFVRYAQANLSRAKRRLAKA